MKKYITARFVDAFGNIREWVIADFVNGRGRVSPQTVWDAAETAKLSYVEAVEVFIRFKGSAY